MKRILLTIVLCLAAGIGYADFEIKDPASPEEAESAEAQMNPINKSSGKYSGDTIRLAKSDYLELIVGNHVHGFKAFDTLVQANDETIFVGIFHDGDEDESAGAEQFAAYLRKELPVILARPQHRWAKDVDLTVKVYTEDRY